MLSPAALCVQWQTAKKKKKRLQSLVPNTSLHLCLKDPGCSDGVRLQHDADVIRQSPQRSQLEGYSQAFSRTNAINKARHSPVILYFQVLLISMGKTEVCLSILPSQSMGLKRA